MLGLFRRGRGQASVELVLVLPLIMLVLLAMLQAGLFMLENLKVSGAAREGAREAAVSPDRQRIENAARRAAPGLDLTVEIERGPVRGDPARVSVSAPPTRVPLAGYMMAGRTLRAVAVMRIEKLR
ncbi:MAG: TadE family protein [Actinomycetota bacterium]